MIWHLYHIIRLLLCPLGAIGVLLSFLIKLCSGAFITRFEAPEGRAILVTGCDSGFGCDFSLSLVKKGWKVYAGCLTPQGVAALQTRAAGSAGTMIALPMDVTKQADIDRMVKKIKEECPKKLFAVVNNAGVGQGGLVDWTPLESYRKTLEVNLFAMIAVCKACLPLLKESKGRIVNVTSIAGIFYGAPCMSAYAASKHAAEAFTTSLRFEMEGWGIKVITINPSFHRTQIATGAAATLKTSYDALDDVTKAEYGPEYLAAVQRLTSDHTDGCWDPSHVVNALMKATTAVMPRTQYIVGADATFYLLPLMNLPTPVVEKLMTVSLLKELVPAREKAALALQKNAKGKEGKKTK